MDRNTKILAGTFFSLFLGGLVFSEASAVTIPFSNPLECNTLEGCVVGILDYLRIIVPILSLIFIVIGAILYILSADNPERTKKAKRTIYYALIGLVISLAAPSFIREIYLILGGSPCIGISDPIDRASCEASLAGSQSFSQIALNVLNFLLGIVGTLTLIMLVVGAIMYLGAGASEKNVEKGKAIVKNAIIGIVVALSSLMIIRQIEEIIKGR